MEQTVWRWWATVGVISYNHTIVARVSDIALVAAASRRSKDSSNLEAPLLVKLVQDKPATACWAAGDRWVAAGRKPR